MKIALASPPAPKSISDGLFWVEKLTKEAALQKADLVCFPESYIPGYPFEEFNIEKSTPENMTAALDEASKIAAANNIAIILPMDWFIDNQVYNVAQVIASNGDLLGYQTKNQLDPTEDDIWSAGTQRHIFEVNAVKFGISICHEGFRYPESVRWAARNGAKIVFHPFLAGSNVSGPHLTEWGNINNPYYEKAMIMRAMENTIYFASVNYATQYPEAATSLIAPNGKPSALQSYRETGVLIADIDIELATGLLAKRFKQELYA